MNALQSASSPFLSSTAWSRVRSSTTSPPGVMNPSPTVLRLAKTTRLPMLPVLMRNLSQYLSPILIHNVLIIVQQLPLSAMRAPKLGIWTIG